MIVIFPSPIFRHYINLYISQTARTDAGGFLRYGSVCAESSVQLIFVFLGQSVERASVKVMPLGLDADLVIVRYVVHFVEHH